MWYKLCKWEVIDIQIEIIHDNNLEIDWFHTTGQYDKFFVTVDEDDYTKATSELMQKLAVKLLSFPFYLHFEGYDDTILETLKQGKCFSIKYRDSKRRILTYSDGKNYLAEVPGYTVKIKDELQLDAVFCDWFDLACANNMWVITKNSSISYIKKYAFFTDPLILFTNHDAYGFTLLSQSKNLQTVKQVFDFVRSVEK
ncbi:hypothetical protein [Gracilibacillus massiliensis]|uniref:hypothetical protein n=1 Tax=Gracilibacillus massiliensis TaxID=1564956 RepID=UPI00071C753D|nr:hypothetical protein [Gracilibacillus massiliensis]